MDKHLNAEQKVQEDPHDLRDRVYRPTLRELPNRIDPPAFLKAFDVRDQNGAPSCTGHALAHLIDLNRYRSNRPGLDRVSAQMLYRTARLQEQAITGEGLQNLRSVIKGFYHYGVCREESWNTRTAAAPNDPFADELTPDRAKEARGITLGAYYRVQPYLNDYHAAIREARAILVSAEIHEGWRQDEVTAPQTGKIVPGIEGHGGHAFVIVGYNEDGFLILNSWGPNWGRWGKLPGVALWLYEDWADRVMDAWVLRLGVSAPEAFTHSNRRQGISFDLRPVRVQASACHQLLGHYSHLDDGHHVEHGSYASTRRSVEMTTARLAGKATRADRQILLSVSGSLLDVKRAFAFEVARKTKLRAKGLYPYALFWCNDVIESATAVLSRLIDEAIERVGRGAPSLDAMIETTCAGIGRAFWRDLKHAARVAGRHGTDGPESDGDAAHLFDAFAAIEDADIHLIVDGAGAVLLGEYLRGFNSRRGSRAERDRVKDAGRRFIERTASLSLIAPTMEFDEFYDAYRPLIKSLKDRDPDRVRLFVPDLSLESKLCVGAYSKSILDLVLRSFEGRRGPDDCLVGMARDRWPDTPAARRVGRLIPKHMQSNIEIPPGAQARQRFDQSVVNYNPKAMTEIFENITALSTKE